MYSNVIPSSFFQLIFCAALKRHPGIFIVFIDTDIYNGLDLTGTKSIHIGKPIPHFMLNKPSRRGTMNYILQLFNSAIIYTRQIIVTGAEAGYAGGFNYAEGDIKKAPLYIDAGSFRGIIGFILCG